MRSFAEEEARTPDEGDGHPVAMVQSSLPLASLACVQLEI